MKRHINRPRWALLGALFCVVAFCSRGPTDSGGGQFAIDISGKVFDKDGKPFANAVAFLPKYGLSDTTGTDGVYRITATTQQIASGKSGAGNFDTLQILRNGQIITAMALALPKTTLADLFVEQRDISGAIYPTITFKRIEAVLIDSTNIPKVAELWYNSTMQRYSGFIYFVYSAQAQNYAIYVNAYNSDSLLTGRSKTIQFSSIAGDIEIPAFDPRNAIPTANAGKDTTVSVNEPITLRGIAADVFDGRIVKMEWEIGNTGEFGVTGNGETTFVAPTTEARIQCAFRTTDNDGNIVTDLAYIQVINDSPVIIGLRDTAISIGDAIEFKLDVSDSNGIFQNYFWTSEMAA